jgi:predicted RNase H-like HicB family nuclease
MKRRTETELNRCLCRRYTLELLECDEGGYFVRIPDLPGCMSQGETLEEAVRNIDEARRLWIEDTLACGLPVPRPGKAPRRASRFVVRIPRELHARLAGEARNEGVSLDQLVVSRLAARTGAAAPATGPKRRRR